MHARLRSALLAVTLLAAQVATAEPLGPHFTLTPFGGFTKYDANFTYQVRVVDAAGNANSASRAVMIDTVAAAPSLALANDSGSSSADGVTNDGTVEVSGLEAGASWEYSTDGGASWTAGTGSSFTLTGDGAKAAIVRQTDVAANQSAASSTLSFTLDTTAAAPTGLDLEAADDSGPSNTDNYTHSGRGLANNPAPGDIATFLTISGEAETGVTVSLFDDADNSGAMDNDETVITTTTAVGGAFSADISLSEGTHFIRAFQVDVGGNPSPNSGALLVTVETAAPAAPTGLDLADADDTGTSNTDNVTSAAAPFFAGTADAGDTVLLFADGAPIGSTTADGTGHYRYAISTLTAGTHQITWYSCSCR